MDVVADIRACLPKAVRAAQRVWDDRENILGSAQAAADQKIKRADARADKAIEDAELQARRTVEEAQNRADNILEEARNRARAMIEQSEIMRRAHEEADKICNDEETVRLRSHIAAFYELTDSDEACGRKLDFLVQEMNREANTIGSKCSDASVARMVVELKNEIEKIREQVQNIE